MSGPLLLVLGDSLAFHGPRRAEPADEPGLWPNVAAAALGGRAELVAGFGWSARDAWWALTRDPRVWALLPRVDAHAAVGEAVAAAVRSAWGPAPGAALGGRE